MTNKTTKKALWMSVLSLILCFSMLIGSTFAWFTDSVESKVNTIVAGNLDVELYWSTDASNWTLVDEDTNVFMENARWEPGHTEVVYLKVVNAGTLDLKYQLGVKVAEETGSVNVNGAAFNLSDYIMYGVMEYEETYAADERDQAIADVTAPTKLNVAYTSDTAKLDANNSTDSDEQIVTMVVYMPTSVGNEANYAKGENVPTIKLGIHLYATQVEGEFDSFGDNYDEDATHDKFLVLSAADLQAALSNAEAGDEIVLENDIEATDPIVITGSGVATYALRSNPITLNLNGKTLTGSIEMSDADVVIENGKIVNTNGSVSAIQAWSGKLTLDEVEITSARHAVRVEGQCAVTINGGTYTAAGSQGKTQHALNVSNGGNVVINGGTFIGPKGTASDSGSAVNVQADSVVTINGGNFSGGKNKTLSAKGTLTVFAGTFDQDPSAYVAETYKAVETNGTYSVIFPQESFNDLITNAAPDATIELPAGTYSFPGTSLQAGQTLNCAPGTVFEGAKLNANGATIVGATFQNTPSSNTVNGIYKDCTFTGSNGLRYGYAGETVVFENCTFSGSTYGVHFDGGANEVIFKNCILSGFNATAAAIENIHFEGCTFVSNGKSAYNGINLWGNGDFEDCVFVFDGSCTYEWIDLCSAEKTATFTNCVVTDGENEYGVEEFVSKRKDSGVIIVDGKQIVHTISALQYAVDHAADGTTIAFGADITGDLAMKSNVTIDGKGHTLNGSINLNGADNVTLKGITFDAAGAKVAYDGSGNAKQYANIISGDNTNKPTKGAWNLVIDGCTFSGTFAKGGAAIAFTDQKRSSGGSGNVTIKNCTFDTVNSYYDIYGHYCGNGTNGYGDFVIENNTFKSVRTQGGPIYLGRYASSTPVVLTGNTFNVAENAAYYVQAHSESYTVSVNASNNTFAN